MKNLFYITVFAFILLSCEKNQTEPVTTNPPIVTYPYDSIHKKLIGNWVSRYPSQPSDSYYYYTITYDTFKYRYKNSSTQYVQLSNYKFFTSDSITAKYKDWSAPFDYKTKVKFYTDDSIMIYWLIPNNLTSMPLYNDITLQRLK